MLKLYNTLTKKVEEIKKEDHINLYTCGPTVYNYAHIGNLRSYILADLLYRTLKYDGYNPRWVINVTDIDDKTRKGTMQEHGNDATVENLKKFTEKFFQAFITDLKEVNILSDNNDYHVYSPDNPFDFSKKINFVKVTDVIIPQIQEFIVDLRKKGYAYKAEDGSTYFSIEKYQKDFGDYGQLVGEKFLEGKKIGARVYADEYVKDSVDDFALWKVPKSEGRDANILWDHPDLGKGRPGWHIECSVINYLAFKGEPTDIHTGGVDLIFPHHTNEIAQSQTFLGKGNFVHHWFHSEHLLFDGKKMAKKLNNFYTLKDLENNGNSLRFLFLQAHYRTQLNFTWEGLLGAHQALERLQAFASSQKAGQVGCAEYEQRFLEAVNDDLDIPKALAIVWELIADEQMPVEARINSLLKFDKVLGLSLGKPAKELNLPTNVSELLEQREQAREKKDFIRSDELRKQIESLGFEVMDTPEGQKVKKKIEI